MIENDKIIPPKAILTYRGKIFPECIFSLSRLFYDR